MVGKWRDYIYRRGGGGERESGRRERWKVKERDAGGET